MRRTPSALVLAALLLITALSQPALADGNLQNVNHIIIVMQENHSFDNYFGVLPYAPGSPYHNGYGFCFQGDHSCVDGLACLGGPVGNLNCFNANLDDNG